MFIKDLNGYEKNIKDIKVVEYSRKNDCIVFKTENRDGELIKVGEQQVTETTEKYVEVTVIGKTNREWTEWYKMEEFIELNPGVEI